MKLCNNHNHNHRATFGMLVALATMTGLTVSSCSSSGDSDTSSEAPTAGVEESSTGDPESDEADAGDAPPAGAEEDDLAAVVIFDVLATEPTIAGPHPELAWTAVEGAASYDLIVLDGAGDPYWAWAGEATSVYLGGVENADAVGAWTFEPLTWIVTARDSDGQPLAMSARAELLP